MRVLKILAIAAMVVAIAAVAAATPPDRTAEWNELAEWIARLSGADVPAEYLPTTAHATRSFDGYGRGLATTRDIPPDGVMLAVPCAAVMNLDTALNTSTFFGRLLREVIETKVPPKVYFIAPLVIAAHLFYETLHLESSRFRPYIQLLPALGDDDRDDHGLNDANAVSPIARLWRQVHEYKDAAEGSPLAEARRIALGMSKELEKQTTAYEGLRRRVWEQAMLPHIISGGDARALREGRTLFSWASDSVKARSWSIRSCADDANTTEAWADKYLPRMGHYTNSYGVSVVPLADMANHDEYGSTLSRWVPVADENGTTQKYSMGYAMAAPKRGVAHAGSDGSGQGGYQAGGQLFTNYFGEDANNPLRTVYCHTRMVAVRQLFAEHFHRDLRCSAQLWHGSSFLRNALRLLHRTTDSSRWEPKSAIAMRSRWPSPIAAVP